MATARNRTEPPVNRWLGFEATPNSMAPQKCKVPIAIVTVNRIDHIDLFDIMANDFNHLDSVSVYLFSIKITELNNTKIIENH